MVSCRGQCAAAPTRLPQALRRSAAIVTYRAVGLLAVIVRLRSGTPGTGTDRTEVPQGADSRTPRRPAGLLAARQGLDDLEDNRRLARVMTIPPVPRMRTKCSAVRAVTHALRSCEAGPRSDRPGRPLQQRRPTSRLAAPVWRCPSERHRRCHRCAARSAAATPPALGGCGESACALARARRSHRPFTSRIPRPRRTILDSQGPPSARDAARLAVRFGADSGGTGQPSTAVRYEPLLLRRKRLASGHGGLPDQGPRPRRLRGERAAFLWPER